MKSVESDGVKVTGGDPARALLERIEPGDVVLVTGAPGSGKTTLVRRLAGEALQAGFDAAVVGADVGQPLCGPPACLSLAPACALGRPAALWFVGDNTPVGNLLPCVTGAARLVREAKRRGWGPVFVDTSGLVEGGVARVLKYHKAVAAEASVVVGLDRAGELADLLDMLEAAVPRVERLLPAPEARDRTPEERAAYRRARYREHFHEARTVAVGAGLLVGPEFRRQPAGLKPGRLLGLVAPGGVCLGLGLLERTDGTTAEIYTAVSEPERAARLLSGRLRLSREGGFAESR